ncbi:hypothetical protein M4951_03865 [Blastopirellula sp. J2-11]|uniref:hypothetical protein n=1 Tax=Blastopirellula sp. J2-11 TaxID=2943192 RepID=UPI0021C9354F|nr:hypothetical protein [Blastopirellula sp. J2-11]UUO07452.1 hypothetical protein M4951_03865 [Blastopirellula sp. J2-11]
MKPFVAFILISTLLALSGGCGEAQPEGIVQGALQFHGQPVAGNARVVLMSMKTGAAVAADLHSDGAFAAEKRLPPGEYVAFLVPKSYDEEVPESLAGQRRTPKKNESTSAKLVPGKYWDEGTSPWRVAVVAGINDIQLIAER